MGYPDWQYDEFEQWGTDYADAAEVAAYDAGMMAEYWCVKGTRAATL